MTLRMHQVQSGISEDSHDDTNIPLQRSPSYRTQSSTTDTSLPRYGSLEWQDNLAALEATQVAQKSPAARAKYDEPALEAPPAAITRSSTQIPAPTPPAEVRPAIPAPMTDIEDLRLRHNRSEWICDMIFWSCFPPFATLGLFHLLCNRLALLNCYPEHWSNFQLNCFSPSYNMAVLQVVILVSTIVDILATIISCMHHRSSASAHRAFIVLGGLSATVMIIVYRVAFSMSNGFFYDIKNREEAIAYIYKHIDLNYLKFVAHDHR